VAEAVSAALRALVPPPAGDPPSPGGVARLVHADLAGNVLLDAAGAPVVIDVVPAWRPVRWADAVCVLDLVLRDDAPATALARWRHGADRDAMLRAVVFRLLADPSPDLTGIAKVVADVTAEPT
jgi:hypothetical protein